MKPKKIVGFIQARMGSTRLPGKMMLPIEDKPLLGHIIDRLRHTEGIEQIILATTIDERNRPMIEYAKSNNIDVCIATIEDDICERLYKAVTMSSADALLKVNGDCPLVDANLLSKMVALYQESNSLDYLSNKIEWSWPEGLSAEIISRDAIIWCDQHLFSSQDREFVATWIKDHPQQFKQYSLVNSEDYSNLRLCVDTACDLKEIREIFARLYQPNSPPFGFTELLQHFQTLEPA